MSALTVVPVLMSVQLRLFTLHSITIYEIEKGTRHGMSLFISYCGLNLAFSRIPCTSAFLITSSIFTPGFFIIYDSTILKPSQIAALPGDSRSEEHTSEIQSRQYLV